uniref:Uncharacterized protein n=1 Tax=Moniliophthora roreri TaxID=221103 RepID=A0A0W0FC74_MONRR
MAHEETKLDEQLEVAEQLLNLNPEQTLRRITHSQWRGAIEGLQMNEETESSETEAKSSSEPSSVSEHQNLNETPSEPEMMTPGPSSDQSADPAPNVQLKVEQDDSDAQWAATIATSIIKTIDN